MPNFLIQAIITRRIESSSSDFAQAQALHWAAERFREGESCNVAVLDLRELPVATIIVGDQEPDEAARAPLPKEPSRKPRRKR